MENEEVGPGLERAGRALRKLRERRRLSLDAAATLTAGHREPLHKSYLHRLEGGQVSPSVSKLSALAAAYGVPTADLVEMFDIEDRLAGLAITSAARSPEDLLAEVESRLATGRPLEALALCRTSEHASSGETAIRLKRCEIVGLIQLGSFETAKSEALRLADEAQISIDARIFALCLAASACSHLKLFTASFALLDHAEKIGGNHEIPPRTRAFLVSVRGVLEIRTGGFAAATASLAEALRHFESLGDHYEACRARINMAGSLIELGDIDSALSHLDLAVKRAENGDHRRLLALASSNRSLACFRRGDNRESRRSAMRSNQIAVEIGYTDVLFRNTFYLAEIARLEGDEASVAVFEKTLQRLLKDVDQDSAEARAVAHRIATNGQSGAGKGGA